MIQLLCLTFVMAAVLLLTLYFHFILSPCSYAFILMNWNSAILWDQKGQSIKLVINFLWLYFTIITYRSFLLHTW